jgi:hypothetical protein
MNVSIFISDSLRGAIEMSKKQNMEEGIKTEGADRHLLRRDFLRVAGTGFFIFLAPGTFGKMVLPHRVAGNRRSQQWVQRWPMPFSMPPGPGCLHCQ